MAVHDPSRTYAGVLGPWTSPGTHSRNSPLGPYLIGLRRWADLSHSFCFVRRANEVACQDALQSFGALTLLPGEHVALYVMACGDHM
jgi:hypothetical protein